MPKYSFAKEEKMMSNFSTELEDAIEAMTKITSSDEMSVLADRFNRHLTYIGKIKARSLVVGDTIEWEYGGMIRKGVIQKINRKTMEVIAAGANPFGRTVTRIQKSMVIGKATA